MAQRTARSGAAAAEDSLAAAHLLESYLDARAGTTDAGGEGRGRERGRWRDSAGGIRRRAARRARSARGRTRLHRRRGRSLPRGRPGRPRARASAPRARGAAPRARGARPARQASARARRKGQGLDGGSGRASTVHRPASSRSPPAEPGTAERTVAGAEHSRAPQARASPAPVGRPPPARHRDRRADRRGGADLVPGRAASALRERRNRSGRGPDPEGGDRGEIGDILDSRGVVTSGALFELRLKLAGKSSDIQAGHLHAGERDELRLGDRRADDPREPARGDGRRPGGLQPRPDRPDRQAGRGEGELRAGERSLARAQPGELRRPGGEEPGGLPVPRHLPAQAALQRPGPRRRAADRVQAAASRAST